MTPTAPIILSLIRTALALAGMRVWSEAHGNELMEIAGTLAMIIPLVWGPLTARFNHVEKVELKEDNAALATRVVKAESETAVFRRAVETGQLKMP